MGIRKTKPERCPVCKRSKEIAISEQVSARKECAHPDCIFKLEIIDAIHSGKYNNVEKVLKNYFCEYKVGIKDETVLVFKTIEFFHKKICFSNLTGPEYAKPYNNDKLEIPISSILIDNSIWTKESVYDVLIIKSVTADIRYQDNLYTEFKLFFKNEPFSMVIDLKNHIIDLIKVLQQNI